ncbi:MAG: tRNA (N6-isopentenyl adenosine(37)-C2)-methylthiotransferase MiaB [Lachnospiraceae bacterium]|nr:tRNA (N6-isopentenyl adenosine(37)-C2)-methylthiotransferase MiaB [Lachnospiraceae bacterium]
MTKYDLDMIDVTMPPPEYEPMRQYYFMRLCRDILGRMQAEKGRPLTCCVNTFGCQMNARDSEKLLGVLTAVGYTEREDEKADLVLYNTCTVRENANIRVYRRLGHLHHYKKQNPDMLIGLCGCMMQEQKVVDKLRSSYPFVDLIFGTHNVYKLAELLYSVLSERKRVIDIWDKAESIVEDLPVNRKYSFKSGVNISFGCNNFCTYCIVPYVRGRERSRAPEDILKEIRNLADDGVIEIMLLGQNVNSYGKDLETPMTFSELLKEVEKIDGIKRIRFMTSHPKDLSDELIAVMRDSKKICRHLHLPLQSGSTRLLKAMNRKYTKEDYLALALKIRKEIPDISLTTDIIVGFPGETEEDFQDTLDVIRKVRYESAFTFIYSPRTGTPAAKMEQVPEKTVHDRFDRLLAEVQDIAKEVCCRDTGKTMEVHVEEVNEKDPSLLTGRLSNHIMVHFPGCPELVGRLVHVKLTSAHGFYYHGEMV